MKVFWSLLAGLGILAAVLVYAKSSDDGRDGDRSPITPTANESKTAPPSNDVMPVGDGTSSSSSNDNADEMKTSGSDEGEDVAADDAAGDETTEEVGNTIAAPVDPKPVPEKPKSANNDTAPKPEAPKETVVRRDDGALVLDDRFVVRGEGTEASPYIIPWDLLISAQDTYQPRLGRTEIPERLKMLDDKWIRITGYVAFPLMVTETDQLLMMMNQWDGCCVGVPPTPYDGIEVKMARNVPADGGINTFHYGTITGLFKVDPYIVNNWLVGLYMIEKGELEIEM